MRQDKKSMIILKLVICIFIIVMSSWVFAEERDSKDRIDFESIKILLELYNMLPQYEEISFDEMTYNEKQEYFEQIRRTNADNTSYQNHINLLISTKAYQCHIAYFPALTHTIYQEVFSVFPVSCIKNSPGGIGERYFEGYIHRHKLEEIYRDLVANEQEILIRSKTMAAKWLPGREYLLPEIFFITDGYADGFYNGQSIVIDLIGMSRGKLYESGLDYYQLEIILAHELNHHFLYSNYLQPLKPQDNSRVIHLYNLTEGLMMEGFAKLCNPFEGLWREIQEDSEVLQTKILELNTLLETIISENFSVENYLKQYNHFNNYQASMKLCDQALRNLEIPHHPEDLHQYAYMRPDLYHTVGAWMIKNIFAVFGQSGLNHLISQPYNLFSIYNESMNIQNLLFLKINSDIVDQIVRIESGAVSNGCNH